MVQLDDEDHPRISGSMSMLRIFAATPKSLPSILSSTRTTEARQQLLEIAAATEGDDADMTEVVKTVERWAGVQVGKQ